MPRGRKNKRPQNPGAAPKATSKNDAPQTTPANRIPKSMVIRMGASDVGPSVSQLVYDMRSVMEPHTAIKLRERRSNKLRDYTTMAGPLGVSHFLLFSRSSSGNTNLRIAVTPRGPTLNFRVESYSLCKDIVNSQKRPKSFGGGVEHLTPPLLVMNNFTTTSSSSTPADGTANNTTPQHLEALTTSIFQSLFPAIAPQHTPLSSIRRVLLLNRSQSAQDGAYTVHLRHYAITTAPLAPGLSRGLKRLRSAARHAAHNPRAPQPGPGDAGHNPSEGAGSRRRAPGTLPDLGGLDDVAEFLLGDAVSGSESEGNLSTDAEVEVLEATPVQSRRRQQQKHDGEEDAAPAGRTASKRAVRLQEIGPRMKLRLLKVEEGLCEGRVLWHEYVRRTREEEREVEDRWERRRAEKEDRRAKQREDVRRKRGEGADDGEMEEGEDEWLEDDEEMEDGGVGVEDGNEEGDEDEE